MAETISLHCQEAPFSRVCNEAGRMVANYLVTGVELGDGKFIAGDKAYDNEQPTMTMPLQWEAEKAKRIAEFYSKYLAADARPTEGWSCHKFVVDVMGWEVAWSDQAQPYYLTPGIFAVNNAMFQDETPYIVKGRMAGVKFLSHSMLGLPDPDYTLGVEGRDAGLWIKPHTAIAKKYGEKVYKQHQPIVQRLGRIGRIFQPPKAAKTFPLQRLEA